jgi:hypothetical protein
MSLFWCVLPKTDAALKEAVKVAEVVKEVKEEVKEEAKEEAAPQPLPVSNEELDNLFDDTQDEVKNVSTI